jgi:hypothetical protein
MRGTLILAAAAVAVVAGCGGGSTLYDAAETQRCLAGQRLTASRADADYIARTAPKGGYAVAVAATRVNVSFWRSQADAENELDAYHAFGAGDDSIIYVKENALLAWDETPSRAGRSTVDGCLKG